ncbi:hypothetical protein ABL78_1750 [Leptomonas seymouri]|uniref:Uncharacterized protein n=1 Tax=Leptomonas seymouri TaxID=5684 RepID=A0A0N0P7S4_LEPSE|nr:hypothetical protein ABL78_1750 [Leptomonas seymouri]|eukprot:KPI89106.1 hypothetical protein ABL78_1750 [Leptomonas seymouri]
MSSSIRLAAHAAGENHNSSLGIAALAHDLEKLCEPYVDAVLLDIAPQQRLGPRASLQLRVTANSSNFGIPHGVRTAKSLRGATTAPTFYVPEALLQECSKLIEDAAYPTQLRSAVELEGENAYLRALLSRLLQRHQSSAAEDAAETAVKRAAPSSAASPHSAEQLSSQEDTHGDGSVSRRSPSVACPEPPELAHVSSDAVHCVHADRKAAVVDPCGMPPATALQVGELHEQIELLREAVRELSQQASVTRGHSDSPLPAGIRAVSPSPRCATPTCTTDVPTLQRIILHQQQTIRTLQLEMEEMESAKVQVEQLLHLHEAAAKASAADAGVAAAAPQDEDDTPCLAATTNWRSTCNTEDRSSGLMASQAVPYGAVAQESASDATHNTVHHIGTHAAAEEMYRMDFDAAAEAAIEKRRAATYGGVRPPLWLDSALAADRPAHLAGVGADEEEAEGEIGDDATSSGMRTPLQRRTVVLRPLHLRFSSATGDSTSMTGGPSDESPVMRPTKPSYGTVSNRHTSVMGSFSAT